MMETSSLEIIYLHVIADTIAPISWLIVILTGRGDEVVALAWIELKSIGHWRERTKADGENSEK